MDSSGAEKGKNDPLLLIGKLLGLLSTIWIILLMFLIMGDVVGRNLFNRPINGVPEMARMSVVAIVFLGLAWSLRNDRWIKSDIIVSKLAASWPKAAFLLGSITNLISCALMCFLTYESHRLLMRSWKTGDYFGSRGDFTFPVWPLRVIIVVCAAVVALEFARMTLGNVRKLFSSSQAGEGSSS